MTFEGLGTFAFGGCSSITFKKNILLSFTLKIVQLCLYKDEDINITNGDIFFELNIIFASGFKKS